jgi:hypothetical protein
MDPHILEKPIAPLPDKTGGQIHRGNIFHLPGGEGQNAKLTGVGQLSSHCRESQALHCLEETKSKPKLTVSSREKLISNSQACPASGRGW